MMEREKKQILAIYDVRGIQDYIFKTPKVKDAIGASFAIESIIDEALSYAAEQLKLGENEVSLVWCTEDGPCLYEVEETMSEGKQIEVLFIGGGNAYVLFADKELCVRVNRLMSKYVLEQTYSLQLAVAMVEKGNDYAEDYGRLRAELVRVKENMVFSAPVAALPIMQIELNTGYPLVKGKLVDEVPVSTETYGKKVRERRLREGLSESEKSYSEIVFEKGADSTLAVVHMDGNNMGLRIRSLVQGIKDYAEAVNLMRKLSYYINHSYQSVFEKMMKHFNADGKQSVIKVLVAGDDITYVCTGRYALSTVEYFCKEMAGYTMLGQRDCGNKEHEEEIKKYGFSVCAGIAYMGGHFPFHIAYEVAEECCESAKERAKSGDCMVCGEGMERVLNFVDF